MKIINGLVFGQDGQFDREDIYIKDGVFAENGDGEAFDAQGCYVVPGFVDVHTHGAMGQDFCDGELEGIEKISEFYAKNGTTSFLATTMTLGEDVLTKAVSVAGNFQPKENEATCLGVHLEGPFITGSKKGAQAGTYVKFPDLEMFNRLQKASNNKVKLISMAPESGNGMEFIKEVSKTCTVSLGHTATDYETAMKAFEMGANHTTHLFNAMNGIHHRKPSLIGASFDGGAMVELICDGIHVHESVVRMTHKMFGSRLVLISDSIRSTGLPDGDYSLGGQPVVVKDGVCTLADGTLAGSSICLHDALKRAVSFGLDLEEVIYALTMAPAKSIKMDDVAGTIAVGRMADCVILNQDLSIKEVFVRGTPILNKGEQR